MKIVIITGGTPPSKKLLTKEITKDSIVIAVDSGANCLWKYKITPDYLIGDLDSINKNALKFIKSKNIPIKKFPAKKDFTDAELALKKAAKLKKLDSSFRGNDEWEIVFLGAIGGKRADHFLGALGLLDKCLKLKIKASLKDDHQTITLVKNSTTISGNPGNDFSLQAFGGTVKSLTITGSKYTLKDYSLKTGEGLTLSNKFRNKKVNIEFNSGKILIFLFN